MRAWPIIATNRSSTGLRYGSPYTLHLKLITLKNAGKSSGDVRISKVYEVQGGRAQLPSLPH
jgi:hypothetical protein